MSLVIRIEQWILTILILSGVLWGAFQIAARYLFGLGWPWGDGLVVMLTVWGGMLAGAVAIEQKGHIALDVIINQVPKMWRWKLELIADVFTSLFVLSLLTLSLQYLIFLFEFGGTSLLTYLPAWLEFLGVPISTFFMTVHGFHHVYRGIRKRGTV